MGVPIALLIEGIQSARLSGGWPRAEEIDIRSSGPHALVVKAEPSFQDAVARHLEGLRQEFAAAP